MYLRLLLAFRYSPEPGENQMRGRVRENERKLRAQLLGLKPERDLSLRQVKRLRDTIGAFNDWETFEHRFPYSGGLRDQPVIWTRQLRCALTARAVAREELDEIEKGHSPNLNQQQQPPEVDPWAGYEQVRPPTLQDLQNHYHQPPSH